MARHIYIMTVYIIYLVLFWFKVSNYIMNVPPPLIESQPKVFTLRVSVWEIFLLLFQQVLLLTKLCFY